MLKRKTLLISLLAVAWPCVLGDPSLSQRSVEGTLVLPAGRFLPVNTVVALRGVNDKRQTTLARQDATFKFYNVDEGTYYVEVEALGYQFVSMKVQVKGSTVKPSSPDFPDVTELPYPLRIPVVGTLAYFEQRQPFNIIAWLKTPYGAMMAFMVGSLVLMPMLKVDPEEYKEMMEERKKLTQSITGKRRD